jgi:hypothetical protein
MGITCTLLAVLASIQFVPYFDDRANQKWRERVEKMQVVGRDKAYALHTIGEPLIVYGASDNIGSAVDDAE